LVTSVSTPTGKLLEKFMGKRIILPEVKENWIWQGISNRGKLDSAKETARIIRLLAENQPVQSGSASNPWIILGYVLGGLFALQILFMLIMGVVSAFTGF
jgi:hypothetical protein